MTSFLDDPNTFFHSKGVRERGQNGPGRFPQSVCSDQDPLRLHPCQSSSAGNMRTLKLLENVQAALVIRGRLRS